MTRAQLAKPSLIAVLVVVSCVLIGAFATNPKAAQPPRAFTKQRRSNAPYPLNLLIEAFTAPPGLAPPIRAATKQRTVGNSPRPLNTIPVHPIASFGARTIDVHVDQGLATVDVTARVVESRPGRSMLWVVAVKDGKYEKVLSETAFPGSRFASESIAAEKTVAFHGEIPLEPGSYNIHARLCDATSVPDELLTGPLDDLRLETLAESYATVDVP